MSRNSQDSAAAPQSTDVLPPVRPGTLNTDVQAPLGDVAAPVASATPSAPEAQAISGGLVVARSDLPEAVEITDAHGAMLLTFTADGRSTGFSDGTQITYDLAPVAAMITPLGASGTRVQSRDGSVRIDLDPTTGGTQVAGTAFVNDALAVTGLAIQDRYGSIATELRPDGALLGGLLVQGQTNGNVVVGMPGAPAVLTFNADGSSTYAGTLLSPTSFTAAEMASRDNRMLSLSAQTPNDFPARIQRPIKGFNFVLSYGQSNMRGKEGYPRMFTSPLPGLTMIGQGPHFVGFKNTANAVGDTTLRPMVSGVLNDTGGAYLTPAEIDALGAVGNEGETPLVGALMTLRERWIAERGAAADAELLCGNDISFSGQPIASLSTAGLSRITAALNIQKAAAVAAGQPDARLLAFLYLQGETDTGLETTKEEYKAGFNAIVAHLDAQCASILGQTRPAAIFMVQIGASGLTLGRTNNNHLMNIQQAQLELALENPGRVFLVGSMYHVPRKGIHLSANGFAMVGTHIGRVMHRVLLRGESWLPAHIEAAEYRNNELLLSLRLPRPGVAVAPLGPGSGGVWRLNADAGLRIFDSVTGLPSASAGPMSPISVTPVGQCLVRAILPRAVVPAGGPVLVQYASRVSQMGLGFIRDGNAEWSSSNYQALTAMPTWEQTLAEYTTNGVGGDGPSLIGKPYPQHNWLVGQEIAAVAG